MCIEVDARHPTSPALGHPQPVRWHGEGINAALVVNPKQHYTGCYEES